MIPTACAEDYGKVRLTDPVAVEGTSREAMLVREIEAFSQRCLEMALGESI